MKEFISVFCTFPKKTIAVKTAEILVGEKLVACCNIIPNMESIYMWQGQMQHDSEVLMVMKSKQSLYSQLEERILQLHPYDVPEIIALPIQEGSKSYLNWMNQVLKNDE